MIMITKTLKTLAAASLALIALSQCAMYEDGGSIGSAEENLAGTYTLAVYLRNDVDETSTVMVTNYQETYAADGSLTRSYRDEEAVDVTDEGTYAFSEDFMQITFSDLSSVGEWSAEHSTLSTATINILRLNGEELWYSFVNGGDTHQFQLIKQ